MISKKIDKIIVCNTLCFSNVCISPDMLEAFSFADVDIVHQKISPFFMSLFQVATGISRTTATFNSNPESNASSFTYAAKQRYQALSGSKSDNSDSKANSTESQVSEHKTKDGHIEADVNPLSNSRNQTTITTTLLCMLSYSRRQQSNLLQMIMGYFLFANNVPKRCIESLH